LERAREAVELARELAHPFNLVYALTFEAGLTWNRGELQAAEATADEAVGIAEQQGFSDFAGMARMIRGAARAVGRSDSAGLEDCLAGMQLAASTGRQGMAPAFLELIGACHRVVGSAEDALAVVDGALAIAEQTGQHFWDPKLLRLRGELVLELDPGRAAEGEADLRRGGRIAREQGDRLSELRCMTSLARLLVANGDETAPENLVRPVYAELTEGASTSAVAEAAEVLGEPQPAVSR
jgi:predicted ATPase